MAAGRVAEKDRHDDAGKPSPAAEIEPCRRLRKEPYELGAVGDVTPPDVRKGVRRRRSSPPLPFAEQRHEALQAARLFHVKQGDVGQGADIIHDRAGRSSSRVPRPRGSSLRLGEKQRERRRGHAVDPRSLPERCRPHRAELIAEFVRKARQPAIVEALRQSDGFVATEALYVGILSIEIDRHISLRSRSVRMRIDRVSRAPARHAPADRYRCPDTPGVRKPSAGRRPD